MTAEAFPLPQSSVEQSLLAAVDGNIAFWMEMTNQLTMEDFTAARDIYVFMKEYLNQYQILPTNSHLNLQFSWQPAIGDFRYWLDEMLRYSKARKLMEAISASYRGVENPDSAISTLIQRLTELQSQTRQEVTAVDAGASERLVAFDWRTENIFQNNRLIGIPTNITVFNDSLSGWQGGDVICCFARPGVGKTWWLMDNCAVAWMSGYRCLCIEPENPISKLAPRIDCIIGNKLGYPLTIRGVTRGDPAERAAYEAVTQVMAQHERWWCYEAFNNRRFNLSYIEECIRRHQPHIVFIDGISLLDDNSDQVWARMWALAYGLKNIAMRYDVPIIFTTQAINVERGRHRRGEDDNAMNPRSDTFFMPTMNDVSYGDAIAQACSDLISMCPEPRSHNINWYAVKKHRDRGLEVSMAPRMAMAVDMSRGIFVDLSRMGYDPVGVGQEAARVLGLPPIGLERRT